ncbi:MAG TPA: hypothetical protein VMX97_15425 [Hyphomicrobiaceae bacterium]|nr:hypothetical protein [Hyphomicrobiaceae bacterium]
MTKPWQVLSEELVAKLPGQLGVYQLADAEGRVVMIGYAGGHSLFGLQGVLVSEAVTRRHGAVQYRCEVNTAYLTRYRELLMLHVADHGALPVGNEDAPPVDLGRLSPL